MIYKKEAKLGENLISNIQFAENNSTIHALKHAETGEDLCLLKCEWV